MLRRFRGLRSIENLPISTSFGFGRGSTVGSSLVGAMSASMSSS